VRPRPRQGHVRTCQVWSGTDQCQGQVRSGKDKVWSDQDSQIISSHVNSRSDQVR